MDVLRNCYRVDQRHISSAEDCNRIVSVCLKEGKGGVLTEGYYAGGELERQVRGGMRTDEL